MPKQINFEEASVDVQNIAAIYQDNDKMERLIFTKDQLINQLSRVCITIAQSFDKVYIDEFKQLSTELSFIMPKQFVGYKTAIKGNDELRICCGNLLRNAANTFIASVDLLRNGFRFQSGILIRSIIEICATVVHLLTEKNALVDFKYDRLSSTKSITIADKQIPLFAKAWGILSKFNIHINTNHADWYPMNEYIDKNEIPASVILGVLGYAALILDIVTELTFVDELEDPTYWKVLEPGKLQFVPPSDERIEWAKDILKDKINKE